MAIQISKNIMAFYQKPLKSQAMRRKTCLGFYSKVSLATLSYVPLAGYVMTKKISLADWQAQQGVSPENAVSRSPTAAEHLVYSTSTGKIKAEQKTEVLGTAFADGAVRIRRETKGRGGKTVLTIMGLTGSASELTALCSELKKKCACGGAIKDGVIEIQGDKRELVSELLQQKGYRVKQAGG